LVGRFKDVKVKPLDLDISHMKRFTELALGINANECLMPRFKELEKDALGTSTLVKCGKWEISITKASVHFNVTDMEVLVSVNH